MLVNIVQSTIIIGTSRLNNNRRFLIDNQNCDVLENVITGDEKSENRQIVSIGSLENAETLNMSSLSEKCYDLEFLFRMLLSH